jgi:mannan endo-1,4-beta-mannosidase
MAPPMMPQNESSQDLLQRQDPNEDLEVTIDDENLGGGGKGASPRGSPTKAAAGSAPAGAAAPPAAGRQWPRWLDSTNKRRVAAGAALLPLVLIPLIVGPVVAAQNNKGGASTTDLASAGGRPRLSLASGGDAGLLPTDASDDVGTLKVPKRVAPPARLPRRAKPDGRLPAVEPEAVSPFTAVRKGQFDRHCRPFYPVGFNGFELVMLAATDQRGLVDDAFESARAMGINTARTWAHSYTPQLPFQTAPGKYDPRGVEALDYVLDSASRHGIQLILSFADNWKYYNGVDQYVDWSATAPARSMQRPGELGGDSDEGLWTEGLRAYEAQRRALFWVDPGAKELYRDHVSFIVNRKNSVNGRVYKADPTILAWNLVNEPRCETNVKASCTADMNAWTRDMAAYVKEADPNHLVTTGYEGFFGPLSDPSFLSHNPPGTWGAQTGQDFVANSQHVDFAVTHAWADNWNVPDGQQGQFLAEWLQAHLQAAKAAGKPLLFEEFGKKLEGGDGDIAGQRDPVFRAAYKAIEDAIEASEPLLGSLYWQWYFDGARFPNGGAVSKAPYGVSASDSTTNVIRDHARRLNRLMNQVPPRPGCSYSNATDPAAEPAPLGVWFPNPATRTCVNLPEAGLAWHTLHGPEASAAPGSAGDAYGFSAAAVEMADALEAGKTLAFPSEGACCRGAFADGCAGAARAAAAPRRLRRFF